MRPDPLRFTVELACLLIAVSSGIAVTVLRRKATEGPEPRREDVSRRVVPLPRSDDQVTGLDPEAIAAARRIARHLLSDDYRAS